MNAHIKRGLELVKVHATLHLFAAICKLKMFSFRNCLFVWFIHSRDSLFPWKVRQGNRVVLRNVVMPVRDDQMPGMVGPTIEHSGARWSFSREADSRAASSRAAASSRVAGERERSRERGAPPPPPPTLPPFMDMAPLEPLSRDQRYYRYVQCPVLCLDSNSFYVKGVTACGLYFVILCFVILDKLSVLSSPSWSGCAAVNSGQRSCVTTTFHVRLEINWALATQNGSKHASCGLAE